MINGLTEKIRNNHGLCNSGIDAFSFLNSCIDCCCKSGLHHNSFPNGGVVSPTLLGPRRIRYDRLAAPPRHTVPSYIECPKRPIELACLLLILVVVVHSLAVIWFRRFRVVQSQWQ
jgi:hypothetical protein